MSDDDHVLQTDEAREPLTSIMMAPAAAIATPLPLNGTTDGSLSEVHRQGNRPTDKRDGRQDVSDD